MNLTLSNLIPHALFTVRDPQEAARRLMALDLPRDVLWQLLFLVVVVSVLLAEVSNGLLALATGMPSQGLFLSPFAMGAVQLTLLILAVFAIHGVGRAMGGDGRFEDALLLTAWLQFIMACLQVLQVLALLVLPAIAWLIGVAGLILFMWLLMHFVAVIHGFRSLGRVFAMIVVTMFGAAVVLSLLMALFGVQIPEVTQSV
ncbi:YIP1 family protein [Tranquillimonas alkanivorans]|uniref:Yip1 domain-containing protein n=1 Tax=Tranquillimonas alkanivorans TaxID=441119 RepID=A0A1I5RSA5_9RHOB|nr:YIP1 family protein [Tranquillimonas alkanivorans]SFP60836.1 Yip1 domain-containing protein [Tranquillimonas alkanivorans]